MQEDDLSNGHGVVELVQKQGLRLCPQLARIERHWHEVRGNRLVPSRAEIDPRGLTGALSHAFVLERIAKGLARFRISGSHVSELMGLEVRGMPLSTVFLPEARQTLAEALEAAFDDPSVIRLGLSAETGFGRPALTGAMILLPLRSDLGEVSRILGGVAMQGDIGRAPRRLGIESQTRRGLTGVGGPDASLSAAFRECSSTMRPRIEARRTEPAGTTVHRHLTLVVDNVDE